MRERLAVCGFCLLIALVAFAAALWTVFSGQIGAQGLDALFLLFVCLLAALVFGMIPAIAVRKGLLKDLKKRKAQDKAEPRAAAALAPNPQERPE